VQHRHNAHDVQSQHHLLLVQLACTCAPPPPTKSPLILYQILICSGELYGLIYWYLVYLTTLFLPRRIHNIECHGLSHLFHECYMPRPSHPPWFYHLNNIYWSLQITKLLTVQSTPGSNAMRTVTSATLPRRRFLKRFWLCLHPSSLAPWKCTSALFGKLTISQHIAPRTHVRDQCKKPLNAVNYVKGNSCHLKLGAPNFWHIHLATWRPPPPTFAQ
jgi:hypothetical protein